MLRKILRKPARKILIFLTSKVLEKHKPTIVSVMGDGQTSIAREVVYQVLSEKFPTRRNLETPEAEFSIPLTIIGYPEYPRSYLAWIKMIGKTIVQISTLKPYKHFLVLELNSTDTDILDTWLKITTSEVVLVVGKTPIDYEKYKFKKIVKISSSNSENILGPYKIAARQIAKFYEIDDSVVEKLFDTIELPNSKVRFFPGVNGSFVIDATHYYLPTKLASVLEVVDPNQEEGNTVIFTDNSQDKKYLDQNTNHLSLEVNPSNCAPRINDVIIIRGDRVKKLNEHKNLINMKIPLF